MGHLHLSQLVTKLSVYGTQVAEREKSSSNFELVNQFLMWKNKAELKFK